MVLGNPNGAPSSIRGNYPTVPLHHQVAPRIYFLKSIRLPTIEEDTQTSFEEKRNHTARSAWYSKLLTILNGACLSSDPQLLLVVVDGYVDIVVTLQGQEQVAATCVGRSRSSLVSYTIAQ